MASAGERKLVTERSQCYILRKQGYKVSEIMKILGKSDKFVMKWSQRGESGDFQRKSGSGRPTKLSSKILKELKHSKYRRGFSTRKLSKKLKGKGEDVCKSSVHNYLKKELGLNAFQSEEETAADNETTAKTPKVCKEVLRSY